MNIKTNNSKPKIAILSLKNSYVYGGVLSSLQAAYNFCKKHFDPTVFFLSFDPSISTSLKILKFSSGVRPLTYCGMKGIEVGARWAFWEPGHYRFNLDRWEELLKGYNYFLAVSGTPIVAHPFALLNKKYGLVASTPYNDDRERRVKTLSGFRYLIDRLANKKMQNIEKLILEQADFIWGLSNYSKMEFEKIMQRPAENFLRCGHPVESTIVPNLNNKDNNLIIAVGRFGDPRKNIDMLLRAFDKINQNIPDSKLYVIGGKPDISQISKFAHLASFKNIVFTGQVSDQDLKNFYQKASLMLLTSYQEGFGVVGIEALWHGIPVIATACGGPSDYVVDGLTGYLVQVNDDAKMAEFATSILQNQKQLKKTSINSQNFVLDNYSISKIENAFELGFIKMYPELKSILTFKF
ncbi:MAG: Glycosyltransferase [candidate division TM6 bacterium GW2011_GWF2_37_49]|nr:MAG: Glycosyltransferase [candidate division TM6 bacterium GW2011_GWF2_37_49]